MVYLHFIKWTLKPDWNKQYTRKRDGLPVGSLPYNRAANEQNETLLVTQKRSGPFSVPPKNLKLSSGLNIKEGKSNIRSN